MHTYETGEKQSRTLCRLIDLISSTIDCLPARNLLSHCQAHTEWPKSNKNVFFSISDELSHI
jgi:hypothetical protein